MATVVCREPLLALDSSMLSTMSCCSLPAIALCQGNRGACQILLNPKPKS